MKAKSLFFPVAIATGMFLGACQDNGKNSQAGNEEKVLENGNYQVNKNKSTVAWTGEMVKVYKHSGIVDLKETQLEIENGEIKGGTFVVDLTTMVATDNNYNEKEGSTPGKLIDHLRSSDFFYVEKYPTASFKIEKTEGPTVYGTLTVKGISNQEKIEKIQVQNNDNSKNIKGTLVFDRKKYDVSWDHPMQDMVLSNDVEVDINLFLEKE